MVRWMQLVEAQKRFMDYHGMGNAKIGAYPASIGWGLGSVMICFPPLVGDKYDATNRKCLEPGIVRSMVCSSFSLPDKDKISIATWFMRN